MEKIFEILPTMDRFAEFLPAIIVLAILAAAARLYSWLFKRHYGENIKKISWLKENQWKMYFFLGIPMICIGGPATEELIFRVPIILLFKELSIQAWWGIIVTSICFGFIHLFSSKVQLHELVKAREEGIVDSDDFIEASKELSERKKVFTIAKKISNAIVTCGLGILIGYLGVRFQSVWLAFGMHCVWNLLMPVVVPLLMLISFFIFLGLVYLAVRVSTFLKGRFRYGFRLR